MTAYSITVLMPVYNAERFLKEAVDSILGQSFGDFEFLIIDDGSTDSSAAIIRSYRDQRIRFVQNERNMGISATLNKGIGLARTELIARMDADDISYPQRLKKQYEYMLCHPQCALLSTWARVITENKEFIRLERYRTNFYYYNLTFECWMYHPTIMFRKNAVEQVGMYSMPYSEDYDLFWKVSTKFLISNLTEPLIDYRISSTSLNTVLRKKEYDAANEQNVVRNIRYYMGQDFTLSNACLECLRHNFKPMIDRNSVEDIAECLTILDQITQKIMEKENVNRNVRSIKRARYFKRKFIITELGKAMPGMKAIKLLIRTQAWLTLYQFSIKSLRWRLIRTIKSLLF